MCGIEDGPAERDQDGWIAITQLLGDRVQLVGDDNFCTNPAIIADAITRNIANSALIKVNQIGTVSETLEAMRPCREAGYTAMVSPVRGDRGLLHRRPRCRDRLRQIKTGAPARGERVAKYNRLLEIAGSNPEIPCGAK